MRNINVSIITDAVRKMCVEANCNLGNDMEKALKDSLEKEPSDIGRDVLEKLLINAQIARDKQVAICQDTGMAVFFVEVGQEVHFDGGLLTDAINEGVRQGYEEGYLRKSVVRDPVFRTNTGDNTPAVIHIELVAGDKVHILFAPKGFGSENMSSLTMLKPSDGIEGIKKAILDTVDRGGPNPCPPIVVGVGIGGTVEKAALLAKKALTRPVDIRHHEAWVRELEEEMLIRVNRLGIGPAGLGGRTTALAVNVNIYPTHIAGLPVVVNINCHATRHAEVEI